jgi:hypothetical protein
LQKQGKALFAHIHVDACLSAKSFRQCDL